MRNCVTASLISATVLLSTLPAIAAPRPVLNQSPQTIERYFGRPFSRLTRSSEGKTYRTFQYNPRGLRTLFPEAKDLRFYVGFVNDRAEQVMLTSGNANISGYPDRADRFFQSVFGYLPSKQSPIYGKSLTDPTTNTGSLLVNSFCLANGIATSHEYHSVPDVTLQALLFADNRCKTP